MFHMTLAARWEPQTLSRSSMTEYWVSFSACHRKNSQISWKSPRGSTQMISITVYSLVVIRRPTSPLRITSSGNPN